MGGKKVKQVIGTLRPLTGAEKLRAIVKWMDNRSEYLNENKSVLDLLGEFNKTYFIEA